MRLFALGALALATLWGCQTWQESQPKAFPAMETTTITVGPVKPIEARPQTFIEALRASCLTYGTFILEYQGVKEKYSCRRLSDGS